MVYGDAIARHASAEGTSRQMSLAAGARVALQEDVPAVPREFAAYSDWLQGRGRLFPRPEIAVPPAPSSR